MTRYSASGNPLTSFVNMNQSAEERRYKYRMIRALGHSVAEARRYRDWRYTSLARIKKIQLEKMAERG